jgi:hypothetical protein
MPPFKYYVSGISGTVSAASDLWNTPLPMNRYGGAASDAAGCPSCLCHGAYFDGARTFLEQNRCTVLLQALSGRLGRDVGPEEIGEIRITLMKHGAFYHPARVAVIGFSRPLYFALNVAASEAGRHTLQDECRALERLSRTSGEMFVPKGYGKTDAPAAGGFRLAMFLADWFHGYHEFHLSRDPVQQGDKIRVWDEDHGPFLLDEMRTFALYRQMAFILTHYYNPMTFEQIFPWHHAAGDFVLRVGPAGLQVRLITVRGYAPMLRGVQLAEEGPDRLEQVMAALLIFLLNLSIRMRIDRLDGTGELAWASGEVVAPMWEGFCGGLSGKGEFARGVGDPVGAFRAYLSRIPLSEGFDLALAAGGGFHPRAAERALLERHLEVHVTALWRLIGQNP